MFTLTKPGYLLKSLTFLAVVGGPAAVVVLIVNRCLLTQWLLFHCSWTQVPTLLWRFIPNDVVVGHGIQDERPVHRGEVTQVRVLLDADGPAGDVPQVVKPNLLQIGHFKDNQGIVVEEVPATNDGEVGEEIAEALQAGHAEEQQVVGDDGELWEAEVAVILGLGDEQDLQESLDHRAVLQALQLMDVIADVDVWPAD